MEKYVKWGAIAAVVNIVVFALFYLGYDGNITSAALATWYSLMMMVVFVSIITSAQAAFSFAAMGTGILGGGYYLFFGSSTLSTIEIALGLVALAGSIVLALHGAIAVLADTKLEEHGESKTACAVALLPFFIGTVLGGVILMSRVHLTFVRSQFPEE